MSEPQLTRIVAGCVLEQHGKFLLVQEKKASAYGLWNLPAGRVDVGESIEEAAVREVREETGFNVELGAKLVVEHNSATKPVLHSFYATIQSGSLAFPADELLDARWLSIAEIKQLQSEGKLRTDWVMHSINAYLGDLTDPPH